MDLDQARQEIAQAPSDDERLALLLAKSLEHYRNHPRESRAWAEEARKLAKKTKRVEDEARAYVRLGSVSLHVSEFDQAEKELKAALSLFDKAGVVNGGRGTALLALGFVQQERGALRNALKFFENALIANMEFPIRKIEVYTAMGNVLLELAEYPQALEYQYLVLELLDKYEDNVKRSIALTNIGNIYLRVQDMNRADSFFERASKLARDSGDLALLEENTYNRGVLANNVGDYSTAKKLVLESQKISKRMLRQESEAYALELLGQIELNLQKPGAALEFFEKANKISKALHLTRVRVSSLVGLGRTHIALKKSKQSLLVLLEALQLAEGSEMLEIKCECYESLAKAYETSNDLKNAVKYFNHFIALSSELHSQQRQRALIEIQARIEIEKADRERDRMERLAKDANERAEILRTDSERQSKELTQLALQLVEKNEFLCNLKDGLSSDKKSRAAKAMAQRIEDHIRSDRDWETFEHQFNQIHRDFIARLSAAYPTLTPTELKIAVLIKLNLASKAIANLFCLSARTVENHRQSLRKKLALGGEDNLVSFLTGFGGVT